MKTIIAPLFLLVLLVVTGCSDDDVDGVGPVITEELSLASFENIDFQIAGVVTIEQGPEQRVMVTSQANIIQGLNTRIVNDTWEINFGNDNYTYDVMEIAITLPQVSRVTLAGSGSMTLEAFDTEPNADLEFELLGSGNMVIDRLNGAKNVIADISGSGIIQVMNQSTLLDDLGISISGSGSFQGFNLPAKICSTSITGSGNTEVTVNEQLNGNISGSGSIFYKGQPQISINITGSGRVVDSN